MTGSHFVGVNADVAPEMKRYYQQMTRFSAAFAFMSDISLLVLGGSVKRRENCRHVWVTSLLRCT